MEIAEVIILSINTVCHKSFFWLKYKAAVYQTFDTSFLQFRVSVFPTFWTELQLFECKKMDFRHNQQRLLLTPITFLCLIQIPDFTFPLDVIGLVQFLVAMVHADVSTLTLWNYFQLLSVTVNGNDGCSVCCQTLLQCKLINFQKSSKTWLGGIVPKTTPQMLRKRVTIWSSVVYGFIKKTPINKQTKPQNLLEFLF